MIPIHTYSESLIQGIHGQNQSQNNPEIVDKLRAMLKEIRQKGNAAVQHYTHQFDGINQPIVPIQKQTIQDAYQKVPTSFIEALDAAIANIKAFHTHQKPKNWTIDQPHKDIRYGTRFLPMHRVGLYVPGGHTPYFSTVMMNAIPALIAGVQEKVIVTPPLKDGSIAPQILVTADKCQVDEIYAIGGAQAIFALAEGTETIKPVDKIVGPGNIYVDIAKQMVYGKVDIDKPAGPSDVLVYVENPAFAKQAASELLAQLEHDVLAIAVAASPSTACLKAIQEELDRQLPTLSRKPIIEQSLKNSMLIHVKDQEEGITCINTIAPEHLVIAVEDYDPILEKVVHAGSIFCGINTPVVLGDYYAGPNHVLPTSGAAKFASPLTVLDFMKCSNFLSYSKEALAQSKSHLQALTHMEKFDAHYNSCLKRFE